MEDSKVNNKEYSDLEKFYNSASLENMPEVKKRSRNKFRDQLELISHDPMFWFVFNKLKIGDEDAMWEFVGKGICSNLGRKKWTMLIINFQLTDIILDLEEYFRYELELSKQSIEAMVNQEN